MNYFNQDRVLIVSEIGINHDGSLDKAIEMIRVSAECGVDICKFQFLIADQMYPINAGTYTNEVGSFPIYDVIKKHEMPEHWIPKLRSACDKNQVGFLMTVCDLKGLNIVKKYKPEMLKIASSELSYLPLFREIGLTDIPLIFSSAGAKLGDIEEALEALNRTIDICLMHCNGKYPTPPEGVNMRVLDTYSRAFPDVVLGFSDHTENPVDAPLAALSMCAKVIEKHFTLDKSSPGPDHYFAVDPDGLKVMVDSIRMAEDKLRRGESLIVQENLLGQGAKLVNEHEQYLRDFCYRSLFAACDISKGDIFTRENIAILRNGELPKGVHPRELNSLLDQRVSYDIKKGEPINFNTLL